MIMNIQTEELSSTRRKLNIEIPAEEVAKEYNEALDAWKKHANIPGFRPGKAPVHLVKAKHHKDIVERLRDHLLPKSYREALEESKIEVVRIIDMDEDIKVKLDEPFAYSITVDVKPEITLPEYKGIALKREAVDISSDDVDSRIEDLREQRAGYDDVTDRPVARGDMVQIDFNTTLDGAPLAEAAPDAVGLDKAEDFWLQADENAFIPELGEGLAGLAIGEERDVNITFDDKFASEPLRNKEVVFHVKIKAVRGRVLPELDEEFLKPFQVADVTQFRQKIKDSLQAEKQQEQEGALRREIEKFLLENTSFDLPESDVDEAANRQVRRIINDMGRQGIADDKMMEQKDEIVEAARQSAQTSVKLRYVLLKIAEQESLSVSENELKREMAMMAYAYGMKPQDLEKELSEESAREEFRGDVLMRKTMQHLFDAANISE
ncbi:MAG: trigger factor [Verrucomicrobia bacterium]|nr:trigger factor [Verrucomicrobiota bacterium]